MIWYVVLEGVFRELQRPNLFLNTQFPLIISGVCYRTWLHMIAGCQSRLISDQ